MNNRLKHFENPKLHKDLPIMRGKVVNNNDPKKIGRVQVRIYSYHGVPELTDQSIPDEDLPWAIPCMFGGSGQDYGSFLVPIPGSFVWLLFENGDVERPVYLGGVTATPVTISREMNNLYVGDSSPQQPWSTVVGKEQIPYDEFNGKSTGVPERGIIYKSQKGHTIMFDDTDGEESMTFIDRVGQLIKFKSAITLGKNKDKYHRELKSAEKNSQLGEGEVTIPSILLRSGEAPDAKKSPKLHSLWEIFRVKMHGESIDSEKDKFTTTEYTPYEYDQRTQTSILNMTEDHIYISFPEILQYFCASYWSLTAFGSNNIICTPDDLTCTYQGNGLHITDSELTLKFKGSCLTATEDSITIKTDKKIDIQTSDSSMTCDESGLTGKGTEISLEGSGKIYTQGGKTYMQGTEIHFTK